MKTKVCRLRGSLREVAVQHGIADAWHHAVDPWAKTFTRAKEYYAKATAGELERPRFFSSPHRDTPRA